MSSSDITVLGANLSPFVRKVLVTLELKGLPYTNQFVMPGESSPAYRAISPLGKIPALTDGDTALCDSQVICNYLEDRYPQPPVRPTDPTLKAKARWIEQYAGTRLQEGASVIFYEVLLKPMLFKQETDVEKVEKTKAKVMPEIQDYLESIVPETGYFFGDFGLADISLVSPFINVEYAGYLVEAGRWPKLAAFINRVKSHPVVASLLEREQAAVAQILGKP